MTTPTTITPPAPSAPAPTGPILAGTPDWADLVAAATVGTDRRGGTGEAPGTLLDDAAIGVLLRRAGALPGTVASPVPAPAETLPPVGVPAGNRLSALLAEGGDLQLDLLSEWLDLAARAGRRLPAELLPAVLDVGRRRREMRPAILGAGGRRAGWLASLNPEWSYLVHTTDEQQDAADPAAWSEGTPGQRAGYLTALRRTDPAAGLALLREEWSTVGPQERAGLLGALAEGLGPDDEEFLEAALDDRRKEVRELAAQLLGGLAGSAYNARMAARARQLVTVPGSGPVLVQPPTEADKALRRDGVPAKPPAGVGERAFWLREILARTPLETWPTDLLGRVDDEWVDDLRLGLARAARQRGDSAWADRLFPDPLPAATEKRDARADQDRRTRHELAELLYPAVSAPRRTAAALAALRESDDTGEITQLLGLCPAPWPAELAAEALATITRLAGSRSTNYLFDPLCRLASMHLSPDHAAEAEACLEQAADQHGYHAASLQRMASTLRLRSDMIHEFNESTTPSQGSSKESV